MIQRSHKTALTKLNETHIFVNKNWKSPRFTSPGARKHPDLRQQDRQQEQEKYQIFVNKSWKCPDLHQKVLEKTQT